MNDEFGIHVNVADKFYKLRCKRSEEAFYRRAAKQINDKILQYQGAFPNSGLELKDLLAMVSLQLSLENLKTENREDVSPVFERLEEISIELEEYLKSNK